MKSRTLVKIKAEDQYLLFRTISQAKKSPTAFYIPRNSLEKLDGLYDPVVVVSNFPDFAEFRRNVARGELQVRFSWMNCTNDHLTGWTEAVTIPYEAFVRFLHNAAEGEQWSVLSSEENLSPRLIFCGGQTSGRWRQTNWCAVSWPDFCGTIFNGKAAERSIFTATMCRTAFSSGRS